MAFKEVPADRQKTPSGQLIVEYRELIGISLRSLAGKAKISPIYLSKLERGDSPVTVEVSFKIATALGFLGSKFMVQLMEINPDHQALRSQILTLRSLGVSATSLGLVEKETV
jgi:transcriptional regulator with XRE-family HTH domain